MFGAIGPRDRFVLAGMVELDDRQHQAALFIHHRETAFLHARNHLGKPGCELYRNGAGVSNKGLVRLGSAISDCCAIIFAWI